jgi:hypothetical protein
MLSVPGVAALATFSGRGEDTYTSFAVQALAQATLLFALRTDLTAYPDDPQLLQLATNAILEMADRIVLEQPHAATMASPLSSESIGSYSYSKGSAAFRAKDGERTGLFWWDLALDRLLGLGRSHVSSGSVSVMERVVQVSSEGNLFVVGPADVDNSTVPFDINSDVTPALGRRG